MKHRLAVLALAAIVTVAMAGCATTTMREEKCAGADWYAIGVDDGRAGYPVERIAEHRKACARANVEPDELRYLQGRRAGMAQYCQPDATFDRNHRAAYDVGTLRKEMEANRSAAAWREAEIRGDNASDSRKSNLRNEVRDLDRRRDVLRDRLLRAEQELQRLRLQTPLS